MTDSPETKTPRQLNSPAEQLAIIVQENILTGAQLLAQVTQDLNGVPPQPVNEEP